MNPNARQAEAIASTRRATVVIAGPGTGKSKVLLMRAVELVSCRGSDPRRAVLLSFTNASVNDLNETIEKDAFAAARGTRVTTFHSLALRTLMKVRAHGKVYIADDWEEATLIDPLLKSALGIRDVRKSPEAAA
jgi:DNA helicase-2/ATP-dependent DNA helicase PcrA